MFKFLLKKKLKYIYVMVYSEIIDCSNCYVIHNFYTNERKIVRKEKENMIKNDIIVDKEKIQEVKKELKEYRENILYIKEKRDDLEEYIALIEGTTPKLSHSNTSHSNISQDKIGNSVGRLDAIKKDIEEKLEQLLTQKFVIDEKINKLEFPYRDILFMRYSRVQSWREITNKLKYDSEDYVYKLHGIALKYYANL